MHDPTGHTLTTHDATVASPAIACALLRSDRRHAATLEPPVGRRLISMADGQVESHGHAQPQPDKEAEQAASVLERFDRRVAGVRAAVVRRRGGLHAWRVFVAVVGSVVTAAGVIMLVTPGPGWLMIFLGLGIWATEYSWARSVLSSVERHVRKWTAWLARQPRWPMVVLGAVAVLAIVIVVWLSSI